MSAKGTLRRRAEVLEARLRARRERAARATPLSAEEWLERAYLLTDSRGMNAPLELWLTGSCRMAPETARQIGDVLTRNLCGFGAFYLEHGPAALTAVIEGQGYSTHVAARLTDKVRNVWVVGNRHPTEPGRYLRREDFAWKGEETGKGKGYQQGTTD